MLTYARPVAPRRAPPSLALRPPERWGALLDNLGDIEDEASIIVLGKDGPDLMCTLLRAGAPNVTHLCSPERIESDSASLVIIPQLLSFDWLEAALSPIHRALIANGRLVVCIDPLPSLQTRVRARMGLHGFTAIRARRTSGRLIISAELPAFGLRRCA